MFSRKCFCKQIISKIDRPLLAVLSANGLMVKPSLHSNLVCVLHWYAIDTPKVYGQLGGDGYLYQGLVIST